MWGMKGGSYSDAALGHVGIWMSKKQHFVSQGLYSCCCHLGLFTQVVPISCCSFFNLFSCFLVLNPLWAVWGRGCEWMGGWVAFI